MESTVTIPLRDYEEMNQQIKSLLKDVEDLSKNNPVTQEQLDLALELEGFKTRKKAEIDKLNNSMMNLMDENSKLKAERQRVSCLSCFEFMGWRKTVPQMLREERIYPMYMR